MGAGKRHAERSSSRLGSLSRVRIGRWKLWWLRHWPGNEEKHISGENIENVRKNGRRGYSTVRVRLIIFSTHRVILFLDCILLLCYVSRRGFWGKRFMFLLFLFLLLWCVCVCFCVWCLDLKKRPFGERDLELSDTHGLANTKICACVN